jgi:hypothetical protein
LFKRRKFLVVLLHPHLFIIMEISFAKQIQQLKLGEGDVFHGEGILAITKALLQSGVSYIGGYQGAPVSHLLDVMVQARELVGELGVQVEACSNEASAAAMLGASIHYPVRGAVTWKSIVGTNVAADALVAGATITEPFGVDATDPALWAEFVSNAASEILTSSNGNLPTHIFVSPNMWKYLMGLTDTSGRPLFPNLGPMNAFGSLEPGVDSGIAFGLRVVVDRNFATDTVIVGDASGFEIFEQMKGAISIDSPSTISRTIAWRGYFSTLMIDNTKFIKATF